MIKINMLKHVLLLILFFITYFSFAVGHIFYQFLNKAFFVVQRDSLFCFKDLSGR